MKCHRCGNALYTITATCPHCGAVLQSRANRHVGDSAAIRMLLPVGRSGWAIAAGYAGLFAVACFPAPVALILGLVAIYDLKRHREKHGWGRAIFGTVMGGLGTLLMIFVFGTALFSR